MGYAGDELLKNIQEFKIEECCVLIRFKKRQNK